MRPVSGRSVDALTLDRDPEDGVVLEAPLERLPYRMRRAGRTLTDDLVGCGSRKLQGGGFAELLLFWGDEVLMMSHDPAHGACKPQSVRRRFVLSSVQLVEGAAAWVGALTAKVAGLVGVQANACLPPAGGSANSADAGRHPRLVSHGLTVLFGSTAITTECHRRTELQQRLILVQAVLDRQQRIVDARRAGEGRDREYARTSFT